MNQLLEGEANAKRWVRCLEMPQVAAPHYLGGASKPYFMAVIFYESTVVGVLGRLTQEDTVRAAKRFVYAHLLRETFNAPTLPVDLLSGHYRIHLRDLTEGCDSVFCVDSKSVINLLKACPIELVENNGEPLPDYEKR